MFLGNEMENPYDHLDSFERLCNTFRTGGVPHDSIKLILFPFSLGGKAHQWERALPSHLVKSWADCTRVFLLKFYPTHKTVRMRRDILSFKQGTHETFHEAWERLKGYTRGCPHHGFKTEAILSIFYWGVDKEHKCTLDVASKGRFANLTIEQGEILVENLAKSGESYIEMQGNNASTTDQHFKKMLQLVAHNQASRDLSLSKMMAEIQTKVDCFNNDLTSKLETLNSKFQHLQNSKGIAYSTTPQGTLQVNAEANPREFCNALYSNAENPDAIGVLNHLPSELEYESFTFTKEDSCLNEDIEKQCGEMVINDENVVVAQCLNKRVVQELIVEEKWLSTQVEVENSTRADLEKDTFDQQARVLKSLQVESTSVKELNEDDLVINKQDGVRVDGESLLTLLDGIEGVEPFEMSAREKERPKVETPRMATMEPKNEKQVISNLAQPPNTLSLHPLRLKDGSIEYKVKCKGGSKPFAKAKANLNQDKLEKDEAGVKEMMFTIFTVEIPRGSSLTPSLATHFSMKPA